MEKKKKSMEGESLNGFAPVSSTPVFWKSRKRSGLFLTILFMCTLRHLSPLKIRNNDKRESWREEASSAKNLAKEVKDSIADKAMEEQKDTIMEEEKQQEPVDFSVLSQKRKALFEPLEPVSGRRPSAESLLPPPDFESASYPKGWLIGKKRKLVNVDVVESMRRIAVQEINRKDREINGLNEQLEEDARVLEHLQLQILDERSKRADVERQNTMLQEQITMLMNMLEENEPEENGGPQEP